MVETAQFPAQASGTLTLGGDLQVYRFGFGAMSLTGKGVWGPPEDRAGARAVLRRALELGINLIDTADIYGPHVNEELIAEALYPYPKDLVIMTKGGGVNPGPQAKGIWPTDGRPEHLRKALEGSLRRLRVDHIDVYQLHSPDSKVPFEDSIGVLAQMKAEGKIRHVGLSNVTADQLARAQQMVEIVTVQNHYNLASRARSAYADLTAQQSEDLVESCAHQGIGFIPWFPLGKGQLAQPGGPLDQIAKNHHATPGQIALAWLLQRSSTMLPIAGTSSVEHLEENVLAATITLTQDEFDTLDRISKR
jgi:Predicted oxidoreductases (related to aryl-alcohol dehydrogenases)